MNKYISLIVVTAFVTSCSSSLAPLRKDGLKPTVVTETVLHDTDDPAIWIHPTNPQESLVIGTDKDTDGGLYVFNLQGKIIKKSETIKRPNNVDIAYANSKNISVKNVLNDLGLFLINSHLLGLRIIVISKCSSKSNNLSTRHLHCQALFNII